MNPPDEWHSGINEDGHERLLVTKRRCPFVGCRYHVLAEQTSRERFPWRRLLLALQTCALDLADAGAQTVERTEAALFITTRGVEVIQKSAIAKCLEQANLLAQKEGVALAEILPERETYPDPWPAPLNENNDDDDEQEEDLWERR